VITDGRELMASAVHQQVAQAVRDGMSVDEIEQSIINPMLAEDDEKAAIWLYAQVLSERPRIRREPALAEL